MAEIVVPVLVLKKNQNRSRTERKGTREDQFLYRKRQAGIG